MSCVKNLIACFPNEAYFNYNGDKHIFPTYSGLGDILQSIYFIYLASKTFDFNLFLDFSSSSINDLINYNSFKFKDPSPKNVIGVNSFELFDAIESCSDKNLFIFCSGSSDHFPDFSDLEFKKILKNIFLSNSKLEELNDKTAFHFRLGDNYITDDDFLNYYYLSKHDHPYPPSNWFNSLPETLKFKKILDWITLNNFNPDFICSDSKNLKKYLKNNLNFRYNDFDINHTGLKTSKVDDFKNAIKDFRCLCSYGSINTISSFPYGRRRSAFSAYARFLSEKQSGKDYYFDFDNVSIDLL